MLYVGDNTAQGRQVRRGSRLAFLHAFWNG